MDRFRVRWKRPNLNLPAQSGAICTHLSPSSGTRGKAGRARHGGGEGAAAELSLGVWVRRRCRESVLGSPSRSLRERDVGFGFFREDGTEFVTVEHCGDDFLATLADYIQDKEDWDDLQAIESEACGALNDIFVNTIPNNEEAGNAIVVETRDLGKRNSLRDPDHENIERFCSISSEDSDLEVIGQNDVKHDPSFGFDKIEDYTIQQPSKSTVSYLFFARVSFFSFPWLAIDF
ncbi:hypothetical protein BHM03_00006198 [Ensete ventricosum]|uniref:Uncharacterized protein n=1 Tax=Ensete ventricosum TaxID=4639 RepID=A0A445MBK7_ENSVE|nr:hypothetical protein BHM03_00006198 [Ensete ventricosum]